MEKDYLQLALAHFNTNIPQWYGWRKDWTGEKRMSYENLILNNNTATMPTEAEVNAKIAELQQADTDKETVKATAKQKLIDLGLTEEEIKALIGV
jgi:hypothetical protein